MRLALQILRKDIERLRWAMLPAFVLLMFWIYQEAAPAALEWPKLAPHNAWLNMALPFVWSLLIALVIHEDPLVGDRQFWVPLPCGWPALLAAKMAFIAAFIQLPYFLGTAVILAARGFNPFSYLPHLFWKQLVLLALIVPAAAVAVTVKNMAQFMLVLITVASALVLFSNRLNLGGGLDDTWDVRWLLTVIVLGVGGLVVIMLQFTGRYTLRSRLIGIATALAAATLYSWLPRDTSAAIYASFSPRVVSPRVEGHAAPAMQIVSREPDYNTQLRWYNFQRTTVLIPLVISPLPSLNWQSQDVWVSQVSLTLTGADGEQYESQWMNSSNGVRQNRIEARLDDSWQVLELYAPKVWDRLRSGPVTIRGRALVRLYRHGDRVTLQTGTKGFFPGLGICSNTFESNAIMRKISIVQCESPSPQWPRSLLRERVNYGPAYYPQDAWLSPIHRGTNAMIGGDVRERYLVPQTQVDTAIVDYTLPGVDLNRYVVHQPVKPEASR